MRENSSIVLLPEHIDCPVKGKNALGGAAIGQLEHLRKHWLKSLLETRSYNARVRQAKPACSHFVTRIFRKIPAAQ